MKPNAEQMSRTHHVFLALPYGLSVVAFALALSSCEYLRLLQFKNQLKQMERYFQFENSVNGLTFTCLRPILTPDDAQLIFEDAPTAKFTANGSAYWRYDFHKRYIRGVDEPANFDFSQVLTFEHGQLATFQYTSTFLTVFDDRLLQQILQAVGQGMLDEHEERLEFHVDLDSIARPTQQQFEAAWGLPYTILSVETEQRHLYVYTLQTPQVPKDAAAPILTLWLVFEPETHAVQRLTAGYKRHSLELSFTDTAITGFLELDL